MKEIYLSNLRQEDLEIGLIGCELSEEDFSRLTSDEEGNRYTVNILITRGDQI